MYFEDHPPPHFHVSYGEYEALFAIDSLTLIAGSVPARARGLVVEWASLHQEELREAWRRAEALEAPGRIAPLE